MAEPRLKRAQGGNWVVGERFWDREKDLELFIEYLDEGSNILLVAPRRIGKTSLMREAARRIEARYLCLHVDLQKSHSSADAIVELSKATRPYAPLWEKTKGIFSNILDQVTGRIESIEVDEVTIALRSALNTGNWQAKGDRLFETLAGVEQPVAIFFDEVPILVNRILKGNDYLITPERRQEADAFMSWLRDNSIRHKGKVRIVITGSIGLEPVLRQAGLSATLNTFIPFDLGPWTFNIATGCIKALANETGIVIPQPVAEHMVTSLGYGIPHHVEMFFEKIYQECRRCSIREVSEALVDEVYRTGMLSVRGHAELSHMEERLKMVLGPELHPLALELLTETALTGQLTPEATDTIGLDYISDNKSRSDALREILSILEHDGYLIKRSNDSYAFQSKLLKDWWAAHFGFGFKKASERKA